MFNALPETAVTSFQSLYWEQLSIKLSYSDAVRILSDLLTFLHAARTAVPAHGAVQNCPVAAKTALSGHREVTR